MRVSFVGSRGGDSFHADRDQIEDIERAVAGMPGASLELMPPELDVSGGLPLEQRPSLLAAVEGVERGEYAGVIVSYLSRLGRSVREQLRAWDRVEAAGGRIVVVREGIDTSTPTGRLQRLMLLGIAEHERELHVERFEARRKHATAAGIWQRRQTPTGYVRDPVSRRLVLDERAEDVRRAFRERAAGVPVVQIADRLGMTGSGVRHLLANRVYLGELRVGQHVNVAAHPALLSVEEWEAAQVSQSRPPRSRVHRGPALLAGLVRCAGCGHVMNRGAAKVDVYSCSGRSSGGRCPEPAGVTQRLLDELVEPIALRELRRMALRTVDREDGEVQEARALIAAATRELTAYIEAVSVEDVGMEAFGVGARSRRAALEEGQARLRRALALRPAGPALGDVVETWGQISEQGKNAVLRGLLEVVVVRRAGGRGGGRGPKVLLADRVRVVAAGTGLVSSGGVGGGPERGRGIVPIRFPDLDDVGVLRELDGEDAF